LSTISLSGYFKGAHHIPRFFLLDIQLLFLYIQLTLKRILILRPYKSDNDYVSDPWRNRLNRAGPSSPLPVCEGCGKRIRRWEFPKRSNLKRDQIQKRERFIDLRRGSYRSELFFRCLYSGEEVLKVILRHLEKELIFRR
jgi:hypothetical protein